MRHPSSLLVEIRPSSSYSSIGMVLHPIVQRYNGFMEPAWHLSACGWLESGILRSLVWLRGAGCPCMPHYSRTKVPTHFKSCWMASKLGTDEGVLCRRWNLKGAKAKTQKADISSGGRGEKSTSVSRFGKGPFTPHSTLRSEISKSSSPESTSTISNAVCFLKSSPFPLKIWPIWCGRGWRPSSKAQPSDFPRTFTSEDPKHTTPCHFFFGIRLFHLAGIFSSKAPQSPGANVMRRPEGCTQCTDAPGGSLFTWSLDSMPAVIPFRYSMTWLVIHKFEKGDNNYAVKRVGRSKGSHPLPLIGLNHPYTGQVLSIRPSGSVNLAVLFASYFGRFWQEKVVADWIYSLEFPLLETRSRGHST